MASQFQDQMRAHYDATAATLEIQGVGEIPCQKFGINPGKQDPGSIVIVGSQTEVGYTVGGLTPGESKITMYKRDWGDFLVRVQAILAGRPLREKVLIFTALYTMVDENGRPAPSLTERFKALMLQPGEMTSDRSQANQPLMVEIPLRVIGRVKVTVNGITVAL